MVKAYKGFDRDLKCRRFQFEIGKTYTHEGKVEACRSGFHAIEGHPLEVFIYYSPGVSRFCVVEVDGDIQRHTGDSKVAASILTVVKEISIRDMVHDAVKWVMDRSKPEGEEAAGDRGAASATGTQGAAMASGYLGSVSGEDGNALFAVERKTWDGRIMSVACGIVGKDGITAGVWYRCEGGKLVSA